MELVKIPVGIHVAVQIHVGLPAQILVATHVIAAPKQIVKIHVTSQCIVVVVSRPKNRRALKIS
jgi:hypothetical protein